MEVSLREHLERLMAEADRRYEERFQGQEVATRTALVATKEALMLALSAVEKGGDAHGARLAALESRVSRFENREEGMTLTTKLAVGAAGLAATLVSLYFAFAR